MTEEQLEHIKRDHIKVLGESFTELYTAILKAGTIRRIRGTEMSGAVYRALKSVPNNNLQLLEEIARLKQALQYYTEATVVAKWGAQELADDGGYARQVLGLPRPDEHSLAKRLGTECGCTLCVAAREQHVEGY